MPHPFIHWSVFCFDLGFWLCPWHVEVPGPGIKPAPELWPEPLQWQCWILNPLSHKGTPIKFSILVIDCTWKKFFFGFAHDIWKFLGRGSNPSHCRDNTGSLAQCTTAETPVIVLFISRIIFNFPLPCSFFFFLPLRVAPVACGSSQPQQRGIWATSLTCAVTWGNARSLTHWARPGIEPASSWILVGLVTAAPQWNLPLLCYFYYCFFMATPAAYRSS